MTRTRRRSPAIPAAAGSLATQEAVTLTASVAVPGPSAFPGVFPPAPPPAAARCGCCAGGEFRSAAECRQIRCNVRAFRRESFPVWRCPACDSLNALHSPDLARYYAEYPFQGRREDFYTRRVFAGLLRRLGQAGLTPRHRILDFGCGSGAFVSYLRARGYTQSDGFDPYAAGFSSDAALERSYEILFAQDVLEHVERPLELLERWRGLLTPGGVLYIGTPDAARLSLSRPDEFVHSLHQPYHRHIFSRRALGQAVRGLGFRVEAEFSRHTLDTLWPGLNWDFLRSYMRAADNTLDAAFAKLRWGLILTSPRLLGLALAGWCRPQVSEMGLLLRLVE